MGWNPKRFKDSIAHGMSNEMRSRSMGDMALNFEDADGRKIKISADYGLQVEDSEDTIIHDTPDCIIADGMEYMGHLYQNKGGVAAISTGGSDTSDATFGSWISAWDKDITTSLPSDLTNAKGMWGYCRGQVNISAARVTSASYYVHLISFGSSYGTTTPTNDEILSQIGYSQSLDADNLRLYDFSQTNCFIPIVKNPGSTNSYVNIIQSVAWSGLTTIATGGTSGLVLILSKGFLA